MIDLDSQVTWYNENLASARLLHAAPETVFDAFKTAAAKGGFFCGRGIEAALLSRNDPQINLALAAYGEDSNVVRALYEASAPKPGATVDERLRNGSIKAALLALNDPHINGLLARYGEDPTWLRIAYESSPVWLADQSVSDQYNIELRQACLGNRRARALGKDAIPPLLAAGAVSDAGMLIANPTISYEVLVDLFNHTGIFEKVEGRVWRSLVVWASRNPRLAIENDDWDGPDLGAWDIQKGVQRLLHLAPAEEEWAFPLISVLKAIDPSIYHKQIDTSEILAKWIAVKGRDRGDDGPVRTSLTEPQELCCLIVALYGAPRVESKSGEDAANDWPARLSRCRHYAEDWLKKDDLDSGYAKDDDAFVVAVLCNDHVLRNKTTREHLEALCLNRDTFRGRYEQRCQQIERRYPEDSEEEPQSNSAVKHELTTAAGDFSKSLTGKLESLKWWMAAGFVVVILILLWRG